MERETAWVRERREWFSNPRGDLFAGLVSAFAVIPEVIGFTIVAGVDPVLGLYTSVAFLLILSLLGGRPAMVSAGAGSMAVLVASLIADHGLEYMFSAVLMAGVLQLILGFAGIAKVLRRIPQSVITGFVDGLAVIILLAQVRSFTENMGDTSLSIGLMAGMVAVGLLVIYLFPKVSRAVPSTLIAILVVTVLCMVLNIAFSTSSDVVMIGDLSNLSAGWPDFTLPLELLTHADSLLIILPYGISLAFVGLLETSLTMQVVDIMTDSRGDDRRECCAQGVGNVVCASMGAMPGCAMIGQAVANVKSGGWGRLSTFVSGTALVLLLAFGSQVLGMIPLAALIAVMLYVCYTTFDWKSFRGMFTNRDRSSVCASIATVVTLVTVILTENLAIGAATGLTAVFACWALFGNDKTYRVR